jgi:hypothetical protein
MDVAPVIATRTTQQLLAESWTSADWPQYSPDLNLLDFSILSVLLAKGQATPHSNLAAYLCLLLRMGLACWWYTSTKPASHFTLLGGCLGEKCCFH